jgi:DNA-directed RNA polymerase subunit E'/Rpb7
MNLNLVEQQQTAGAPTKKKATTGQKNSSIYSKCIIQKKIPISIVDIGKNVRQHIEKYIAGQYEGKCIVEGFIKPDSTKVISFSTGIVKASQVIFDVVFECMTCFPVEGMLLNVVAKNITKAGIRAESVDETPSPIVVFIARDHHYSNSAFSKIQEGDTFVARVIGQRFELNDTYVSVIAEWMDPKKRR